MEVKLKNKFIQGYGNGLLFSLFLGVFEAPFQQYSTDMTKQQLRHSYSKYVGTTMLKFPPMPALFALTCAYLEKEGYDTTAQYSGALLVGCVYLQLVRFK